jgi:hypothetical protein
MRRDALAVVLIERRREPVSRNGGRRRPADHIAERSGAGARGELVVIPLGEGLDRASPTTALFRQAEQWVGDRWKAGRPRIHLTEVA